MIECFIYISLLNCKGYKSSGTFFDESVIDRNLINAVECIWDDESASLSDVMKPAFDSLANAFGRPHSINYDSDGNYNSNSI